MKNLTFRILTILCLMLGFTSQVWAEDEWVLTQLSDLTNSDVFVIVDQSSATALTNDNGTTAPTAAAITLSEDKQSISGVTDNMKWNIGGNATDGYTFYPNGVTSKWLYTTNANDGLRVGNNDYKTFSLEDNWLKNTGTSRYVGVYIQEKAPQDWRCYTSSSTNISNTKTAFYKLKLGNELTTVTWIASEQEYENGVQYNSATVDSNISLSFGDGGNDGKYYNTGNGIRIYSNGKLSVTAVPGCTITGITLSYSETKYAGNFSANTGSYSCSSTIGTWSGSSSIVVLTNTATSDHARIQKIVVSYKSSNSYQITIADNITNGTISSAISSAASGTEITLTATPDDGYVFEAWNVVKTESEEPISVNGGKFIMPAADVTISATFIKQGSSSIENKKDLEFSFVTHPSNWPATKNNAAAGTYSYQIGDESYDFSFTKSGDGIYLGGTSSTSGYLLMTAGNKLRLPAIEGYKLTKVVGTLNNQGTPSTASQISVITDDSDNTIVKGGEAQTWSEKGGVYTYILNGTYANTSYYLYVTNKNCQMIELKLTYEKDDNLAPSNFNIDIASDITNGTVSASVKSAKEGTEISLSATPDAGYTLDMWEVTNTSTGDPISVTENKFTMPASDVTVNAVFKEFSLCTIEDIFEAAKQVGTTPSDCKVVLGNWIVSGVNGSNAYVTDNNGHGFIIYTKDHGFVVGDILSGTIDCKIQLYKGSAELTDVTSSKEGLAVTKGGSITPLSINIADLSGVNTGALISLNELTYDAEKGIFITGNSSIKPYKGLIAELPTLQNGTKYNVTGIFLQYDGTKEILPRYESDITECTIDLRNTNVIFFESFDNSNGSGGNDDQWNGNIASSDIKTDNTGWVFEKASGAAQCAKFGIGSTAGLATTPKINLSGNALLVFKAAAWNSSSEKTTIEISASNANLSSSEITLQKGIWSEYQILISEVTGEVQISFEAPNSKENRFFLDEIMVLTKSLTSSNNLQGWKTFYDEKWAYEVDDKTTIYTATLSEDLKSVIVSSIEGKIIPAKTSVLLKTENTEDYKIALAPTADEADASFDSNILQAAKNDGTIDGAYILAYTNAGGLAFYNYSGELEAGDVYLKINGKEAASLRIIIDETATAINDLKISKSNEGVLYNLSGHKVGIDKGLVIKNGKIMLVK